MSNSFIYNDEDDVNELYSEEEEEQEEIDDRGVSEIYEDEEFERQNTDNVILSDFPKLDSILAEGRNFDDIPEGLDARQEDIYRKGIKLVKDINKRCKCTLNFNGIINSLNAHYTFHQKIKNTNEKLFNSMCVGLSSLTRSLAIKSVETIAYSDISEKTLDNDLKRNFKELSKVVRLYPLLYPEKFPRELARISPEEKEYSLSYSIFTSKGKLRDVFKIDGVSKFKTDEIADDLKKKSIETSKILYGSNNKAEKTEQFVVNKVKEIIGSKDAIHNSQGDRVRKLAECVRLLRPMQAKREKRTFLDYLFNHDVYVAERDTLRKCKEEMKRLGLNRKEISKVLHGGSFNDVKFTDGMTVRSKLQNPNEPDALSSAEILKNEVNENVNVVNDKIEKIIVDDAVLEDSSIVSIDVDLKEENQIINNEMIQESKSVEIKKRYELKVKTFCHNYALY